MSSAGVTTKQRDELLAAARHVMAKAYAPYSDFQVGAAILTASGKVFTGCNVENASYGLTICAERNAIFAAIAAGEKLNIVAVAVTNSKEAACSPCGACRQVIAEFGKDAVVYYQAPDGIKELSLAALLPDCFTSSSLG